MGRPRMPVMTMVVPRPEQVHRMFLSFCSPNVALSRVARLPARIGTIDLPGDYPQRAEMQACHVGYSAWLEKRSCCPFLNAVQRLRE